MVEPIKYIRQGECNHCGWCCIEPIDIRLRVGQKYPNPCKFLKKIKDQYFCKIKLGEVKLEDITEFERDYYLNQCEKFPDADIDWHWVGITENCGYTRKEV